MAAAQAGIAQAICGLVIATFGLRRTK